MDSKIIHKKCDKARVNDIELNDDDIKDSMTKPTSELDSYDFANMRWLFNKSK